MRRKHNPLCVLCLAVLGVLAVPAAVFVGLLWAVYSIMDRVLTKTEKLTAGE